MKNIYILLLAIILHSCNMSNSGNGNYSYKIRLEDTPGHYDGINIDIQSVAIVDSNGNTILLDADVGIHNVLKLSDQSNNIVLASRNLEDNKVSQIKIKLGGNNNIVINGKAFPLLLSASGEASLTINASQILEANKNNEVLISFDFSNPIITNDKNAYKVKSVIRIIHF